ncbi:hypothetical protein cyc_01372 [Cyclospora cayetanensis]|uniref:CERLI1-like PH domain-containing protein n=1 Tax=Cyclospora cayetanensis TaxID=88456 RepID=A0A1D3CXW4_9EIME|nr:hypothetical protein cyc_01372 [Cyclospora cayetanensis]
MMFLFHLPPGKALPVESVFKLQAIPHPSECYLLGLCFRKLGCHDHDKFDMLVEERLTLHVRQCEREIQLSFHRLDTANVNLGEYQMSPLIHQALLHAQYEAEGRGEPLKIDINSMSDLQRLRFFSKVLEGPLKLMSSIGGSWIPLYFKATERRNGKWEWQYWDSKEECLSGAKKKGGYSFLAISLVLPDKYDRNTFYMRYHNHQGVHDLFFRRVDRDRNLWSNGLYEFIEKLREYLEKSPELPAAEAYLEKKRQIDEEADGKSGKHKKSGSKNLSKNPRGELAFSRSQDLLDIKRIASPRQTAATEQERPRIAELKRRMVDGLMMEAASDDSDATDTANGKQIVAWNKENASSSKPQFSKMYSLDD